MYITVLSETTVSLGWLTVAITMPVRATLTVLRPNMNLVFLLVYVGTGIAVAYYERRTRSSAPARPGPAVPARPLSRRAK
jgi:hypothetical protein